MRVQSFMEKTLTEPVLTKTNEYFDQFMHPISLMWIVDPIRLHKNIHPKEQLELIIFNASADPNSFGECTDPYTRKKYPRKIASCSRYRVY